MRTSGLPAPTGLELILHWYQLVQTSRAVQPIAFGHGHIKISGSRAKGLGFNVSGALWVKGLGLKVSGLGYTAFKTSKEFVRAATFGDHRFPNSATLYLPSMCQVAPIKGRACPIKAVHPAWFSVSWLGLRVKYSGYNTFAK